MSEVIRRNCGTVELDKTYLRDPAIRKRRIEIETASLLQTRIGPFVERPVITIPVVCHIVYNTPEQNISNLQIASQIKVLNQDFRMLNTDIDNIPEPFKHLAADARIEFRLARRDPDGNETNGITRTASDQSFSLSNDYVKFSNKGGKDAWDPSSYLNIWVCDLIGRTLGYAFRPGMAPDEARDGVVIGYKYFGTQGTAVDHFNKGRTATHEVGHYLDLYHIWGPEDPDEGNCSGSDNVQDTPNQLTANYGDPDFPNISCNNGPNGDMFMNFMDYVYDESMYMFTYGQIRKMDAAINGPRYSLQTSNALTLPRTARSMLLKRLEPETDGSKLLFNGAEYVEASKLFP
ncbi:MAG: hypothetical protein K0S91_925 [Nitrososphaeraceae archaeon]|jgi:hypothetical protein|nr:hypothetical protein [Nitrososphaeraceae archaeon]